MDHVAIDYRVWGVGWADCTITIGDQTTSCTASFLTDSLKDMLVATSQLLQGDSSATVWFEHEPGWTQWQLRPLGHGRLAVRVRWTESMFQAGGDIPVSSLRPHSWEDEEEQCRESLGPGQLISMTPAPAGGSHLVFRLAEPDWESRLGAECMLTEFAEAVHHAAYQVLAALGIEGYKQRWDRAEFPLDDLQALAARLRRRAP